MQGQILKILAECCTVILAAFFLYCLVSGKRRYQSLLQGVEKKERLMTPLFAAGLRFLEMSSWNPGSLLAQKRRKMLEVLMDEQEARKKLLLTTASETGAVLAALLLGDILCIETGSAAGFLAALLLAGLWIFVKEYQVMDLCDEKKDEEMMQLPGVISKLILLLNSGMALREAWKAVSAEKEGALYLEMRKTSFEIGNGVPESEAYIRFAKRCDLREISHFASYVTQNLKKGNREMAAHLQNMADEIWDAKKALVTRKEELAGRLLLIPSILLFAGIIILIVVPMLHGIQL